jgi:light-regulated signal transduction histidine kinase (bacteriophytochrome)
LLCNDATSKVLGRKIERVLPEDWPQHYGIYLPDGISICPSAESPLVRAIAGEVVQNMEVRIRQSELSRPTWCTISFEPLRNESEEITGGVLLIKDITSQKNLQYELERSNSALQQFATVAAHDLQEPLRSIAGFTDMWAQHQVEQVDEKSKRCMSKIKDGIKRMQTLINDLLNYSRVQTKPQNLVLTDCNVIVQSCVKSLNARITETGAIVLCDSLPKVMADASQLSQVFQNLMTNALKFCPTDRSPIVSITAAQQGLFWRFCVEDNGIGIESQFLERIFLVFRRLHTKSAYAGTGIGLSICQRIAERHGGRIWVESEPGAGSKFFFTVLQSSEATI